MANQLTRIIMENIVNRCKNYESKNSSNIHLNSNEEKLIKNIIYNNINKNYKTEVNSNDMKNAPKKHITIDELIGANSASDRGRCISKNEETGNLYFKGIKKVSLDDIIP